MSLQRVAQFELLERLGEGGMGEVFRAMDTMLEREVAIKALRPALAERPDLVERFRVEAIALAKLNHPNIAAVYNFIQDHGTYYMVMLFVRGRTLEQVLAQRTRLPWAEALGIVVQTLRALEHAHGLGVIHRDLKPANLMLRNDGSVVVMDFGIARVLARARQTRSGNMVGTLEYMSPEQVQGRDVDGRADFYALGVMLYEMLTGRLPFIASTDYDLLRAHVELTPPAPSELCHDVPAPVETLVRQAMAKEPRQRFANAEQFLRQVEALLPQALPSRARPSLLLAFAAGLQRAKVQLASVWARRWAARGRPILFSGAGVGGGASASAAAGASAGASAGAGAGAIDGAGLGRPVWGWAGTARAQALRNPGLAVALVLVTVAGVLALAGAVSAWRRPVVLEPVRPPIAGEDPFRATPPQQTFPGITIVEDKPKPVESFPKSAEPGPIQAPAPVAPAGNRDPVPAKRPPPQPRSDGGWYVR